MKISKRSIYAVRFPITRIYRYAQKNHGYANDLLDFAQSDAKAKGKIGMCILSSAKKRGFLADPKFLKKKGFSVCDESDSGIQLWYLPFEKEAEKPQFKACAKNPHTDMDGYVLYYTNQCPFTAKYVPVIENIAREHELTFHAVHLESKEDAQNAPTPTTTYSLFYNGRYLTNEILSDKKFLKIIQEEK